MESEFFENERFYKFDENTVFDGETCNFIYKNDIKSPLDLYQIATNTLNYFPRKNTNTLTFQINLSSSCNLNCKYCYRDKSSTKKMSMETFEKIVDFVLIRYPSTHEYVFSFCMASESSLEIDFLSRIKDWLNEKEKITGKKLSTWFMTNGTCASDEFIALIDKFDLGDTFWISIDGNREANQDRIGVDYDKLLENIEKIKIKGSRKLEASVVLTPNHYDIVGTAEYLKDLGFSKIQFVPARQNEKFTENNIHLLIESYNQLYNKLEADILNKDFTFLEFLENDSSVSLLYQIINGGKALSPCGRNPVFDTDGNCFPCLYLTKPEFSFGNIDNKISIKDFKNVYYIKGCEKCWAKAICGGTCYAENYIENGDIYKKSELSCIIRQYKIKRCLKIFKLLIDNSISLKSH